MRGVLIEYRIIAAVGLTMAYGCSQNPDPASETSVDPLPGLYEITHSGAGLLKHAGSDKTPERYCLKESQQTSFPHILAENYYKLHYSCMSERAPREGNAVSGEISCAADPKMATGMNSFVYNGVVGEEKTSVEVGIKFDAQLKDGASGELSEEQMKMAMKAMERMRFAIEAKRIGDC